MPTLRQKVTTYFRQLSFIAERDDRIQSTKVSDGSFITRYLDGTWKPPDSIPKILCGKDPLDVPEHNIGKYKTGPDTVTASYTGPNEGLTGVRRMRVHLSAGPEIDFIDNLHEHDIQSETTMSKKNSIAVRTTFKIDPNANKRSSNRKEALKLQNIEQESKSENCITHKKKELVLNNQTIDNFNDNTIIRGTPDDALPDPIANVRNWNQPNDHAYGISISLYEKNVISGDMIGNPVADCFGIIARDNCCIMAMADGVNWGEGARLAARCAIQGSIDYLNSAIFGIHLTSSTKDIFVSLVRSFWEAHSYILEAGGALTTLTVLVVLPSADESNKYLVCCCNVGDSLGYVYSQVHGVREITEASHDVTTMRDMRDALGALGPVNNDKPELSNLTLSLTVAEKGDIVFLTSDGVSDNFDPVVGKFAEPLSSNKVQPLNPVNPTPNHPGQSRLAPKRQNKSSSSIITKRRESIDPNVKPGLSKPPTGYVQQQPARRPNSVATSTERSGPIYMRSKTFIEPRLRSNLQENNKSKLPQVTGVQRHQLTLLRMADLLMYGINGSLRPCSSAKQLCQLLIDFVTCITAAKRKLLEQRELYYKVVTDRDGSRKEVEFTKQQQKIARKRMIEGITFSSLPGKLDHASIVAFTIGVERTFHQTSL
ncbi:PP2C-like domain-containing protein CG9801 [Wyeomyia smithii]|uniref:PP2C-like domain-containing protein CG9801 n=1 Tax=Wyeomyia smithii TaxID=174621 RepID=UPI0024681204|nr:PP2C-like domain-containing protein CG9801 [Wyeomyia smithii]